MEHCERYTVLLSARLDGELTLEEEQALEAHLDQCPDCRALASRLTAIHSAFPELEEVPAPENFAKGVMDRVRWSEEAKPKVIPLFRRPQFKAMAGLAACFVLCLGVYQAGLLGRSRQEAANLTAAGLQAAAGQPAPSLFTAAPGENDAAVPESGMQTAPQVRAGEQQTQEKNEDTGVQTCDLAGVEQQSPSGEEGEGPGAVQSQMGLLPAEPSHYSFANDQYLPVCYGQTPQVPSARILGSGDSLAAFLAQFPEDDLSQVSAVYGEDFFEHSRLLAVVVEESSGSVRHTLDGLERDRVTVLRQEPGEGTCDMAAWLILAEVDDFFRDGDTLTVVFQDQ